MGLFDFLRRNLLKEKPIEDENKIVVESENTDDSAPGWEAIDTSLIVYISVS